MFENLDDPRAEGGNKQHELVEILFITLCATIAGCQSYTDIEEFAEARVNWFRRYVPLQNGVPSHDTIGRVLAALDTASFQACLRDWIDHWSLDLRGQGVHVDGKTLRRSFDAATNRQALHMVSAWSDGLNVCLGQVSTQEKSNEITAVPKLLELLNIRGAVVTLDAMNCQRKTAATIVDREADYLMTVKANQASLHRQIVEEFDSLGESDYTAPQCRTHRTRENTRGRVEERIVTVAPAPRELKESGLWANLQTIGMVYRHREEDQASQRNQPLAESDHVTYFISSLPPKAKTVARYVRQHWTVENSLHWTLDVTFSEDASRLRKGNGPEIMASFRRAAISLLKRDTSRPKTSLRLKRKIAGWCPNALESIILGF